MQDFVDFVRGIYRNSGFIPLHEPVFIGNEKKYLIESIDSGYVSSVGKFVDQFEEAVVNYTGAKYAVAVMNGTSALHTGLILAQVERDDEVITQPFTFVATANAISYTGAKAIFVDIDKDTLSLSPEKLEVFLKKKTKKNKNGDTINTITGRKIRSCIPMHTFGHPGRIDDILNICHEFNIPVIEDACESMGSFYKGKHTGTSGLIGTLSFNGNKTITTGSGGMILTNDENIAKMAKHISTQAKVPHPFEYVHDQIGYNYRMSNLSAAVGLAQLEKLDQFIRLKRKLSIMYQEFFNDSDILYFTEPVNSISNYWLNAIILESLEFRNDFLNFTNKQGIMTRPAWELLNKLKMFNKFQVENIDNAEWIASRLVNIPSSVNYNEAE